MRQTKLTVKMAGRKATTIPLTMVHTLVIGSGAAGLNAAVQLRRNGVDDVLILTEGLSMGTSINTGSDKQTYYKLNLCGNDPDSPRAMAETYFAGGSMHGDLALVEATYSARAFSNLVNLGVPFPRDEYGQFVGYKTDHDPRQRATSIGPYTSREMCRALIREVEHLGVPIREKRNVVELLVRDEGGTRRATGAIVITSQGRLEAYGASNVVFAVGGPGGLYKTSVYPRVHTGGIGLALKAGALAQSLPESQFGLASTKFRWNVSGTYMQVIPRFISTAADGTSDVREFLREYFPGVGEMNSNVFLKGYQWPFDSRKAIGGSSIVDILVYVENVLRKRRVFLDFRANPDGFRFEDMSPEARDYLAKSNAAGGTPIERLRTMNPGAIQLYREHGINIEKEPLEIAVCSQHNNGGIAGNHWWESVNVKHLFPIGEVNGSHGVYRPGGAALNSGQVAGFRAAEYIANRYRKADVTEKRVGLQVRESVARLTALDVASKTARTTWQGERAEFQERMTHAGSYIRDPERLDRAIDVARGQCKRLETAGCAYRNAAGRVEALRNVQLAFAHLVYLEAIRFWLKSGVGSRGSAVVMDRNGQPILDTLGDAWRIQPENPAFREQVMETVALPDGRIEHRWVPRRPIPEKDVWFETTWARYRHGDIYDA